MKKNLVYSITLSLILVSTWSFAQLTLPQPSPKASVMQTVGITDITIDYSSPGVKGRTIWGDLVPYNEVWRTGANAATNITFSRDVKISGTKIPKGKYSIFTIPGTTEWIIIINKDASASVGSYKQEEDLVRVKVKPETTTMNERMMFSFKNFDDNGARIDLDWEKLRVSFMVEVSTDEQAMESIDRTLNSTWRNYNNAARYMNDSKKDYNKALEYANQSISLKEDWFNVWVRAQAYAGLGKYKEALADAQKAKLLGDKNPDGFFFKDNVESAIKEWGSKANPTKSKM